MQKRLHALIGTETIKVELPFPSQLPRIVERLRIAGYKTPWFGDHRQWVKRVMFRQEDAWVTIYPHIHLTAPGWGDRFWNGAGMWCMRRDSAPMEDWPAAVWLDVIIGSLASQMADVLETPPSGEEIVSPG